MKDPRFNSISKIDDLALLEPKTRELVNAIIANAAMQGVKLMVYETYRSIERQQQLSPKETELHKVGVHHFGLACDLVYDVNGQPSWTAGDFSLLGHLAYAYGLIWGGDWGNPAIKHTIIDKDHLQRCSVVRQAGLFTGKWYPDDSYNPYIDK